MAEFVAQGGRPQDWRPAYSIAPTVNVPIVREWQDEGTIEREITLARWDWPKPPNRPTGASTKQEKRVPPRLCRVGQPSRVVEAGHRRNPLIYPQSSP
ncbi:MAG: hypothetical protein IE924_03950 [Microbacterium sp.]|uniref:hypothetical protein n=1 Tax=Microbacterium sp. TaxID=51671 RepID=UPI00199D7CF9|nr:hypothetical protein [Microbacterium sp.]MBD3757237.1 hypothetical protein [Microbacterium sp.]